ncbi:hypothetical protein BJF92_11130 [Rhizobium rhizosphaerae]|uniref:Uncharacterized protein n=1 Tax=Xaviernesmea rhizosphaerae TaxID=1672749 RepID=A0A1Q9AMS6_9HYPH|nr:hypothetical protein BJF92_11130 [Xaviernesmea rhizosphaerae]
MHCSCPGGRGAGLAFAVEQAYINADYRTIAFIMHPAAPFTRETTMTETTAGAPSVATACAQRYFHGPIFAVAPMIDWTICRK